MAAMVSFGSVQCVRGLLLTRAPWASAAPLLLPRHHEIRHPEEGALELGVGDGGQGLAALLGVAVGDGHGVLDRTVFYQNLLDLLAGDALEAAVVQNSLNGLAVGGGAVVGGVDHGPGGLGFAQGA